MASLKVMVMAAPNGARRSRRDHPDLPVTEEEVAATAGACVSAGAAAVHLHVRDADGGHTLDAARYHKALRLARDAVGPEAVLQITTEAVGMFTPDEQMDSVRSVRPEAVSLAIKELIPDEGAEKVGHEFLAWIKAEGIAPQFILYEPDDLTRLLALRDSGVVPFARPFALFVLGRYTSDQQSAPEDLEPFLDVLGRHDLPWAVCAFGRRESECALAAAERGGHVRVGFENNLHLPDGRRAGSNEDLVAATVARLEASGHAIMAPAEARAFLAQTLA